MLKICVLICTFISTAVAAGDLIILNHPKNILFKGHEHIEQKTLKEMYSAALGFSVEQSSSWSGMYLTSPFNLAEAIVTVYVDGVNDVGTDIGHHYSIHTNEDAEVTWNALEKRVIDRYPNEKPVLVHVELSEGAENVNTYKALSKVQPESIENLKHLKLTVDEDQAFLNELGLLNGIVSEIENGAVKHDYIPDVYWFILNGLHAVSDLHGDNSSETLEAKQLLGDALSRMNVAFRKAYNGNVLVSVISSDASHTRFARSLLEEKVVDAQNTTNLNLAKVYSADYPVIFNIIFWFSVAMIFSLLATALVIGGMDPGRDSIIYRMTSNRMKKDN